MLMKDAEEQDHLMQVGDVKLIKIRIMKLMEIRKRAIKYCESLSGLTDKEKEIAYKSYISALSNKENPEKRNEEEFISDITLFHNDTCTRIKHKSCNTPSSC